jgi:uncharacterized protein (DUF2235 family)
MSKTLVVFCDGTAQHAQQEHPTNVYKLYELSKNVSPSQIAFYSSGVGTDWRFITGRAFGNGIANRVVDCYEFIAKHYESGDHIFLFGFSRGATAVRMLCGLIQGFGIRKEPGNFRQLYRAYEDNIWHIFNLSQLSLPSVPIRFLGVWDTVGALSDAVRAIPLLRLRYAPGFGHHFPHNRLLMCVQNARQAVAIDEDRYVFGVTFFDQFAPEIREQSLKQVWFAGHHSDIGGGVADDSLSKIPFRWMAEEALSYGLTLSRPLTEVGDPNGAMHNARSGLGWLYPRRPRFHSGRWGTPLVHASVLKRTRGANNRPGVAYVPWITKGAYEVVPCSWI